MEDLAFTRFEVVDAAGNAVHIQLQVRPTVSGVIRDCDPEFGCLSSEYGIDTGECDFEADEVTLALVHRNKSDAG